MKELWKKIPEFPEYSVSTHGRVRNDLRERIIQPSYVRNTYLKINLYRDGIRYTRAVKSLVADAFLKPPLNENFDTAMPLDGDPTNLHISNLVWRPKWFAWKYAHQMSMADSYANSGPIIERRTEIVYDGIVEASLQNGLLFYEVSCSLVNKIPVFPDWRLFDWYKQ